MRGEAGAAAPNHMKVKHLWIRGLCQPMIQVVTSKREVRYTSEAYVPRENHAKGSLQFWASYPW